MSVIYPNSLIFNLISFQNHKFITAETYTQLLGICTTLGCMENITESGPTALPRPRIGQLFVCI
jgi:hypothetical protein